MYMPKQWDSTGELKITLQNIQDKMFYSVLVKMLGRKDNSLERFYHMKYI